MTENARKFWKLALIAVPVIIANIGSYAKARVESRGDNKASYETLRLAVVDLQKNAEESRKDAAEAERHVSVLEGEVAVLKDMLAAAHPGIQPILPASPLAPVLLTLPSSSDAGIEAHPRQKPPAIENAALPANFDDVVEQYKSKK